jgi:hypothetical protein
MGALLLFAAAGMPCPGCQIGTGLKLYSRSFAASSDRPLGGLGRLNADTLNHIAKSLPRDGKVVQQGNSR